MTGRGQLGTEHACLVQLYVLLADRISFACCTLTAISGVVIDIHLRQLLCRSRAAGATHLPHPATLRSSQ